MMDPSWIELVKVWGPLSLGWVAAAYMGKFIMDRYDRDIEAKSALAKAIDSLTKIIEDNFHAKS